MDETSGKRKLSEKDFVFPFFKLTKPASKVVTCHPQNKAQLLTKILKILSSDTLFHVESCCRIDKQWGEWKIGSVFM